MKFLTLAAARIKKKRSGLCSIGPDPDRNWLRFPGFRAVNRPARSSMLYSLCATTQRTWKRFVCNRARAGRVPAINQPSPTHLTVEFGKLLINGLSGFFFNTWITSFVGGSNITENFYFSLHIYIYMHWEWNRVRSSAKLAVKKTIPFISSLSLLFMPPLKAAGKVKR